MTTRRAFAAPLSRRAVFGGAGAVCAAVLLSGCGGDAEPVSAPPPAGASGATPAPAPPTPNGPAGALVRLADVPVGGGVIAPGPVLVVQLTRGQVKAYDATCPHMAITIGVPDASGRITCPGHGGHFAAADGARIDGPAPRGLTPVVVALKEGFVVRA